MVIMKIPNITAAGGDALTSFEGNVTQTATAGGSGAGAGVGKAIGRAHATLAHPG